MERRQLSSALVQSRLTFPHALYQNNPQQKLSYVVHCRCLRNGPGTAGRCDEIVRIMKELVPIMTKFVPTMTILVGPSTKKFRHNTN